MSNLRKEYFKVRASEVIKNLPPGAASDADIAMAKEGFPSDKANGKQVASFLRGVAKLKGLERKLNEFKANYISENGSERGMLQAWKESQAKPAEEVSVSEEVITDDGRDDAAIYAEYGVN